MRSPLLLALLASASLSCTMPDPEGFQFECDWNEVFYEDDVDESDLCPERQVCRAGCCVSGEVEPTCHLLEGFGESGASAAGASCSGGCSDYSCKGSCPGESPASCLDEQSSGFPGGLCTWPCSNCDGFCAQLPGLAQGTCVSTCRTNEHCRKGYRCDCSQPSQGGGSASGCGCIPDCRSSPAACGEGRTVEGSRCDGTTGRCHPCLPLGQGCVEGPDCCSGNCCNGLCLDAACE